VFTATELVVTVKVAELAFAATVTLADTCAAAVLLLTSATMAPPLGARPVSVTVPTEVAPAGTEVGFRVTELSTGGVTVKLAFWVAP
jgi:hypothetical protein